MQTLLRTSCAALLTIALALIPLSLAFAQSSGDSNDDGWWNDSRRNSALQAQIAALGDTPVASIPIPVLLGVELSNLSRNFGDARSTDRLHEGLDIMAPEGTPIVSPTDAVVTRIGNGASSGLYVRTINPGGESFVYMHLASHAIGLSEGSSVKRGDVIGFVGNTGNAVGGAAHLHFEIRKNGATDPFPRITHAFTLAERMQSVAQALERGDSNLAAMLVTSFRGTFNTAVAQGIPVPQSILVLLPTNTSVTSTPVASEKPLTSGAVVFGEKNADIVTFQTMLISKNAGAATARLAAAGATGYFGPVTQAALIEYQIASGLSATGVLDDATRAKMALSTTAAPVTAPVIPVNTGAAYSFSRDLKLGMTGDDVKALQTLLNAQGYLVTSSGVGSPGQESTYFGALTQAALIRYQASKSIAPAAGYFGPLTRASIS